MALSDSHDRSLKHLLAQGHQDFIRFALRTDRVQVIEPVELDHPARDLTSDGGYLIDHDGTRMVAHVEFLRRHQGRRELALDVGETQVRLCRREQAPVVTMVWDLGGSRRAPLIRRRVLRLGPGKLGSRVAYCVVNLRAWSARELLEGGPPVLWPLVPLTRGGNQEQAVARWRPTALCW